MQITVQNVQLRGKSLSYRIRFPDDLRHHYDGLNEYNRSLKTKDTSMAYSRAVLLNRLFKEQFKELRAGRQVRGVKQADDVLEALILAAGIGEVKPSRKRKRKTGRKRPEPLKPRLQDCKGPLLSEVLEELTAARPCKYRSQLGRNAAVRLMTDWCGDLPVDAYTWKMVIEFRDNGLMCLPANIYKKRNEGLTLRQLAQRKHIRTMSPNTVNNKLNYLTTVFNFARNHGYISFTPTSDIMLKLDRIGSRERDCYSRDQLQRMVDKLADLTQVVQEGNSVKHQHFWVTLICLYSGARLNEIAQLLVSDIFEVDGIPCMNISEEGVLRKSLKNSSSWRVIPIHPVLIDLGLMRYHQERFYRVKNPETVNLWPRASSDGYGDGNWGRKVSKWFARTLRPRFLNEEELEDIRERRKSYCFHSLRHTFIRQAQNQARMLPRIEMRMTGHADPFISEVHARYGKDLHPLVMLEELVKLDYGLDLSKLRGRY